MKPARREPLPDVLRALALLGVVLVNAAGYAQSPEGNLLGSIRPAGDALATLIHGLLAALVQGKAYPVLAFLFGWGLGQALKERGFEASVRSRQRLWRLLLLGVLHGSLLYFGDVLTTYALCGLLLFRAFNLPWRHLRRWLGGLLIFACLVNVAAFLLLAASLVADPGQTQASLGPSFQAAASLQAFLGLNLKTYLLGLLAGFIVFAPTIGLCMLAGVASARLRLLTHPRWAPWRKRFVRRWALPALGLNLVYGLAEVTLSDHGWLWSTLVNAASPFVGLPLAACAVLALAQRASEGRLQWAQGLLPLGQRTLSVYVAHSLWTVILFSGVGLAWFPGTVVTGLVSLAFWLCAALLAAQSTRRWPLETWMGRRS